MITKCNNLIKVRPNLIAFSLGYTCSVPGRTQRQLMVRSNRLTNQSLRVHTGIVRVQPTKNVITLIEHLSNTN